jgi:hypothetical protein
MWISFLDKPASRPLLGDMRRKSELDEIRPILTHHDFVDVRPPLSRAAAAALLCAFCDFNSNFSIRR